MNGASPASRARRRRRASRPLSSPATPSPRRSGRRPSTRLGMSCLRRSAGGSTYADASAARARSALPEAPPVEQQRTQRRTPLDEDCLAAGRAPASAVRSRAASAPSMGLFQYAFGESQRAEFGVEPQRRPEETGVGRYVERTVCGRNTSGRRKPSPQTSRIMFIATAIAGVVHLERARHVDRRSRSRNRRLHPAAAATHRTPAVECWSRTNSSSARRPSARADDLASAPRSESHVRPRAVRSGRNPCAPRPRSGVASVPRRNRSTLSSGLRAQFAPR